MRVKYEDFRDNLPEFMGKVTYGDEQQIIITKDGMPVAKLIDYYAKPLKRRTGHAKGKFVVPDDFDTTMSDEIAEMFGVS